MLINSNGIGSVQQFFHRIAPARGKAIPTRHGCIADNKEGKKH